MQHANSNPNDMEFARSLAAILCVTRKAWFGSAGPKTRRVVPIGVGTIVTPLGAMGLQLPIAKAVCQLFKNG
jgi:hypothetical protein